MHGQYARSIVPKLVWTVAHLGLLYLAAWIYFGGGIVAIGNVLGQDWQAGNEARRLLLFTFGLVLWIRMLLTAFIFLQRRVAWGEVLGTVTALALYQLCFALLGARTFTALSGLDVMAISLFIVGSLINTGSEFQRKRFKANPANQGKLYTQGLFAVVRHPNYLGDLLWVSAWASLTRNPWSAIIVLILASGFIFVFIPELSHYLAQRYDTQYETWASKTNKLIPYIY